MIVVFANVHKTTLSIRNLCITISGFQCVLLPQSITICAPCTGKIVRDVGTCFISLYPHMIFHRIIRLWPFHVSRVSKEGLRRNLCIVREVPL